MKSWQLAVVSLPLWQTAAFAAVYARLWWGVAAACAATVVCVGVLVGEVTDRLDQ